MVVNKIKLADFLNVITDDNKSTYLITLFDIGHGFVGLLPSDSPLWDKYLEHIVTDIEPGCMIDGVEIGHGFYVKVLEDMS